MWNPANQLHSNAVLQGYLAPKKLLLPNLATGFRWEGRNSMRDPANQLHVNTVLQMYLAHKKLLPIRTLQ